MHQSFVTTTRGLNRDLPPMRLYEKAKRPGIWNPSDIDLSLDKVDWSTLKDGEDDFISYAMSQFTKRFERLEKARAAPLDEINRLAKETEDA
ncbi:MAG: hypothetical protein ABI621_15680 [Chloroflexota bacterium]